MKFCSSCGKELDEKAIICPNCGCATANFNNQNINMAKQEQLSTLALIGFIFSFISCLVGLICSCIAYKDAVAEGDEKSKNFSKAGIIISSVLIGISVFTVLICIIIFAVALGASPVKIQY